jgi:hypothetical protein
MDRDGAALLEHLAMAQRRAPDDTVQGLPGDPDLVDATSFIIGDPAS